MNGKKSFAEEPRIADEESKKKFFNKHGPKTPQQIEQMMIEKAKAQEQYTEDVDELEANLKEFNERKEALVDPVTKKPLFFVRHPSQDEWEKIIPQELWKYKDDPDKMPADLQAKYKDHVFNMMAALIVKPVHDAQWWKANAPLPLQILFNAHLEKVYEELGINVANF